MERREESQVVLKSAAELLSRPEVKVSIFADELIRIRAEGIYNWRMSIRPPVFGTDVNDWVAARAQLFENGEILENGRINTSP